MAQHRVLCDTAMADDIERVCGAAGVRFRRSENNGGGQVELCTSSKLFPRVYRAFLASRQMRYPDLPPRRERFNNEPLYS